MTLYLGQTNTDRAGRMNSERLYNGDRSTAYTAKMVRCRDTMVEVVEPLKLVQSDSHGHSHSYSHSDSRIAWFIILVSLCIRRFSQ